MRTSITLADVFLEGEIFLGTAQAFNLDQPALNRFFARMARALLHKETRSGYVTCAIEWRPIYDLRVNNGFLRNATQVGSIGELFSYAGYRKRNSGVWYWSLKLFGQDFLVKQTVQNKQRESG